MTEWKHADECEFSANHSREHPCGRPPEKPGEPCRFCSLPVPESGACPECWTPVSTNLADAKALLALGGLSLEVT